MSDVLHEFNILCFGFLSLSDSDSDDEPDDSEPEEEESELDPDEDLSDGERADFLFVGGATDLILSLFIFFVAGGGGGEGDLCLDFSGACT